LAVFWTRLGPLAKKGLENLLHQFTVDQGLATFC